MRTAKPTQLLGLLVCCLFGSVLQAQSPAVPQVVVDANQARIEMSAEQQSYLLEISGPNGYYFRQDLPDVADIRLAPAQADGTAFEDGSYQVQITPVYRLTEAQQAELLALSQQGDVAGIRAYRESNNLPTEARTRAPHPRYGTAPQELRRTGSHLRFAELFRNGPGTHPGPGQQHGR
jgi:hypothetical protein